jgi:hypothetical protein
MTNKMLIAQPFRPAGVGKGRIPLTSLSGVITECARSYRRMKADKMKHDEGWSLVWVLSRLRAMLEAQALERIEGRLRELQAHSVMLGDDDDGYMLSAREAIAAH